MNKYTPIFIMEGIFYAILLLSVTFTPPSLMNMVFIPLMIIGAKLDSIFIRLED